MEDFRIITCKKLEKTTSRDRQYHENKTINFSEIKGIFFYGFNQCISFWCKKIDIPEESFWE